MAEKERIVYKDLDNPVAVAPEKQEQKKTEAKKADPEEEEEEEEVVDTKAKKKADDPDEEEEEEELDPAAKEKVKDKAKAEEEEEEEEEEEKEPVDKKDKKDEKEEEPNEEFNGLIKDKLAKKYEIDNEEKLIETLDSLDTILEHNLKLEKELEEVKASKASEKPQFKSKSQEKAWEFIKDIDPAKQPERMLTWAKLNSLDPEKDDGKLVLEEQYILKHPELDREEAQFSFAKEYNKKYLVAKEKFDDDNEFKEEEKLARIKLKSDTAKAREFLKKQQEEYKAPVEDKKDEPEENEAIKDSVAKNTKKMETFLTKFDKLEFVDGKDKFSYKFSEQQKKELAAATKGWVQNPLMYDQKGELKGFEPEEAAKRTAFAMWGEKMFQELYRQATTIASTKRVEEIASTKPSRKAPAGDAMPVGLSEEEQQDRLIKKREEARKNKHRKAA